jgi:cytochrome c5
MFKRFRLALVVMMLGGLLAGFAGCSPAGSEAGKGTAPAAENASAAAVPEVTPGWRGDRQALGKATYDSACASCHAEGASDAPRTGHREDWAERSDMWQAVLSKHAKSGYLEMPGKGGQAELSDESVEAATEYMLGLTFPELPQD